jgi:hypothetical protein
MAFAASALKRSGSLADYNAFIANIKKAQADGDINAIDYFDQLPDNYTIGSAKDYAQAFVGPMADYSEIEPYSIKTPALKFLSNIMGKPLNSRKQMNQKLELRLKAAGIDTMDFNSDAVLPTIRFLDYKFNLDQKPPLERLNTISKELAKPELSKEKREYYLNARTKNLEKIKASGSNQQKIDANNYEISLLDPEKDIEEIAILKNENIALKDAIELVDLSDKPLELLEKKISIKHRELLSVKNNNEMDASEKVSMLASIREELTELTTQKSILKNDGYDTFDMQVKRAEEEINRKLTQPGYKGSDEHEMDKQALSKLKVIVKQQEFDMGSLDPRAMTQIANELKIHLFNALRENPELNSKIREEADGTVRYLTDTPEVRIAYADFINKEKINFFTQNLNDFTFYDRPEMFAMAMREGIKPTEEQKISKFTGEDVISAVLNNKDTSGSTNTPNTGATNQTNTILDKNEEIDLNKQENTLKPLDTEEVDKLLKLKANVAETPEKFIEDLQYYYPNISDSIKNQINNYFENKDTASAIKETYETPKKKAIGDDFFAATVDLAKKGGKKAVNMLSAMASKGSVDGTIYAAKTDYYDTDADAESKKFILEELAKYLKRKNYSEDRIQKTIEKIKNPANIKKASGGLMSKKG